MTTTGQPATEHRDSSLPADSQASRQSQPKLSGAGSLAAITLSSSHLAVPTSPRYMSPVARSKVKRYGLRRP